MDKTAQLLVTVLVVAFVIERITAVVTFFTEPITVEERKRQLRLVALSGLLAAIAVWYLDLRLLRDGMNAKADWRADMLLTWLVIVGGAGRIRDFVMSPAAPAAPPEEPQRPIEIVIHEADGKITATRLNAG
jgi:hypothetical protein